MSLAYLMSGFAAAADNLINLGTMDYNTTSHPFPRTDAEKLKIDPENEGSEQQNILGRFYVVPDRVFGIE